MDEDWDEMDQFFWKLTIEGGTLLEVLGEEAFCQCATPDVELLVEPLGVSVKGYSHSTARECRQCGKELWAPPQGTIDEGLRRGIDLTKPRPEMVRRYQKLRERRDR